MDEAHEIVTVFTCRRSHVYEKIDGEQRLKDEYQKGEGLAP